MYTDVSWSFGKNCGLIAAIFFGAKSGEISKTVSPRGPLRAVELLDESPAIYGLGIFDLVSRFAVWKDITGGCQFTVYIDNDPSPNGLIKGAAKFQADQKFIMRFRKLVRLKYIYAYLVL